VRKTRRRTPSVVGTTEQMADQLLDPGRGIWLASKSFGKRPPSANRARLDCFEVGRSVTDVGLNRD